MTRTGDRYPIHPVMRSTVPLKLNLLKLVSSDHGIRPRDLFSSNCLEIKRTPVLLRVPMDPTKRGPTPAPKPSQPGPPPANQTPVRPRRHRHVIATAHDRRRHYVHGYLRQGQRGRGRKRFGLRWIRGWWRRRQRSRGDGRKGDFDRGFGGGG